MPASMMSAPTGGRPKVIGSSMATVATVPIPGRTPTKVPTNAPSRQNPIFTGCAATEKPSARFENRSNMLPQYIRPKFEWQIEHVDEQEHAEERHRGSGNQTFQPT